MNCSQATDYIIVLILITLHPTLGHAIPIAVQARGGVPEKGKGLGVGMLSTNGFTLLHPELSPPLS